jgi:hypothetical protein
MTSLWVCAGITAASALVSLGFAIEALVRGAAVSRLPSRYALARSLALAIAAVVALFTASVGFVVAIAIAMTIVQAADAIVGGLERDRMKTVGPAVLALLNLASVVWVLAQRL